MESSRPVLLRVGVALVVLLVAGGVVTFFLTRDGDEQASPTRGTQNSARSNCPPEGRAQVIAFFEGRDADSAMLRAADQLRGDDKVLYLDTQTRSEAFAELKDTLNDPQANAKLRADVLPAAVRMLPVDGVSLEELAGHVRDEYSYAEVDTGGCAIPAR